MEMSQFRYFIAVAETLNFTQAAKACGVSQPSLTRAIRKLEEDLGGPLFRREGRNTHLSELGRTVLPRFEQAVALADAAQKDALDFLSLRNATLRLGCMCTIAPQSVMSIIEFFRREAPDLKLNLREGAGSRIMDLLTDGEIDIALTALPSYPNEFEVQSLFSEQYVITFPRGHRFSKHETVAVSDLAGESYLKRVNCEYLDCLEAAGHSYHFETEHRFQSEHETWVQAMVIAGLGCAIMPSSLAENPELQQRPLVDPSIERTISVITRRGRPHTPAVDLFVKLCRSIDWSATRTKVRPIA